MRQLSNVRKAVAGLEDTTLTRWIKLPDRGAAKQKTAPMPLSASGTRFKTRVIAPSDMSALLVSGHSNVKIGRDVRKGRFKGYWIYTLSLEERATCPRKCLHWVTCYGNASPLAKRIDHTAADFLPRLEREIEQLLGVRGRRGVLIRLHALGDFYSELYVAFWWRMLEKHENLAVFGYTARCTFTDPIGLDVAAMSGKFGYRCMIRESDGGWPGMSTVSIKSVEERPANAFVCPEQTGQTRCCATCGACWSTTKNVAFLAH